MTVVSPPQRDLGKPSAAERHGSKPPAAGTGTVFAEADRCRRTNGRRDAKTVPVPAVRVIHDLPGSACRDPGRGQVPLAPQPRLW
jgi:hypothetical protein